MNNKKMSQIILGSLVFILLLIIVFLVRRQWQLEEGWRNLQRDCAEICAQEVSAAQPQIVEKVLSTAQLWRPVQDRVRDTVVQVFSQVAAIDLLQPFKTPKTGTSSGTGFFISEDGEFITNAHVVDQAKSIWVQIPSLGKQIIDVDVVGVSPERDLALLRVRSDGLETIRKELGGVPYLNLGDSDLVRRSDEVLALGYPLGQQAVKSTTGVVSGREQHLIQISAPINPGSSGGPLLNIKGEVVGINSSGIVKAQNVGYAIPINTLKTVLSDLYEVKLLRKPFMGVMFNNATPALTEFLGNPLPGGCYIAEVVKGSTLEKAGVQRGDMIYEIDGFRVDNYGEMSVPWSEDKVSISDYPLRLSLGDNINLQVYRKGERKDITATFRQSELPAIRRIYPGLEEIDYEVFGGMVVMPLSINHIRMLYEVAPGLTKYAEVQHQHDPVLVITHIFPNSQLYRSRSLVIGTTINEVNGKPVKTLDEFRDVIRGELGNKFLTINGSDNVTRASDNVFVVLEMEKVLQDEEMLSRDYKYQLTDATRDILRVAKAQKLFGSEQQQIVTA